MSTSYLAQLDELTRPARLFQSGPEPGAATCTACPHRCRLGDDRRGVCGLRVGRHGQVLAPWGYTSSVALDPLEKKPLFHVCPGSSVLSFGMLGCNLHCPFCQNWTISQTGRDESAVALPRPTTPEQLAAAAERAGSRWIAATYNEPLITAEWVVAVFQEARRRGLRTAVVSNGFASPENLALLSPWVDAANIDLKCFTEKGYHWLGGRLQPVLECIRALRSAAVWVEVTTLVVPSFNDSPEELGAIAGFLAGVSPDTPWHVSAYHPDYRLADGPPPTPAAALEQACASGREVGLHFVYAGNLRGRRGSEDTRCPGCGKALVTRRGFTVLTCSLGDDGRCPDCHTGIAGVWR